MNDYSFLRLLEEAGVFDATSKAREWLREYAWRGGDVRYELEFCCKDGLTLTDVFKNASAYRRLYNNPPSAFFITRFLRNKERPDDGDDPTWQWRRGRF